MILTIDMIIVMEAIFDIKINIAIAITEEDIITVTLVAMTIFQSMTTIIMTRKGMAEVTTVLVPDLDLEIIETLATMMIT